ncbi:MAG: hypothetical protein K2P68_06550 [Sphingomonas sp.]|nr:hypothetical protein [Sphingomonas sp.]
MSDYASYADFIAKIRNQLEFKPGGRPTGFQLHHIIPKEVLTPIPGPTAGDCLEAEKAVGTGNHFKALDWSRGHALR